MTPAQRRHLAIAHWAADLIERITGDSRYGLLVFCWVLSGKQQEQPHDTGR